jgi:hypothetical protein
MTSYFIRYTGNPSADQERGYSFVGYNLFETEKAALETLAQYDTKYNDDDFSFEAFADENDYRIAKDNVTGKYGIKRSGLCGFGEFDSVEDAIENMSDPRYQYHATQFAVIFEGVKVYDADTDGLDDGITFRPVSIAAILEFDGEKYNS